MITASMLYNLVACPHRVALDLFGDLSQRDPTNAFVEMLWDTGNAYEAKVISELTVPVVDLSEFDADQREIQTAKAMDGGASLIYGGRIRAGDLLGEPDLLRKEECGYVPGDIKSGSGEEGGEAGGKPKVHYAVQLALYVDVLQACERLTEKTAFVWDIHGVEVRYDLSALRGKRNPRALWDDYVEVLANARAIVSRIKETKPAFVAACKLCHWYSACTARLESDDDLTLLPELGRARRDVLATAFPNVRALAEADLSKYIRNEKTEFHGVGVETLERFQERAQLRVTRGKPYAKTKFEFPSHARELFFDVETHPMIGLCYLHGFVVRERGETGSERYVSFFAENNTQEAEQEAFANAWSFIAEAAPSALYYYSPYERIALTQLGRKYPDVCSEAAVTALFASDDAIDIYSDFVRSQSEWPTADYSIKTLASYCGFAWRDAHPSGAASIEWFTRYLGAKDQLQKQRILDYNEDDCRAMRVVLDVLKKMPVIERAPE